MPEIAEVRLIADNIYGFLNGTSIVKIEILHPDIIPKYIKRNLKGISEFNSYISNNPIKFLNLYTKGKFCWIQLEYNWLVLITFGMSGNVRIEPTPDYLQQYNKNMSKKGSKTIDRDNYLKHCHLKIIYKNDNGDTNHFYYHDIRRFGSWTFTNELQLLNNKLDKLGHDPLNESKLPDKQLIELFRKFNSGNICKILMSQKLITGVGNYIVSEVLYSSKICPLSLIKDIPDENILILYDSIRKIALDAYKGGGASLYTFTGMDGDCTEFKNELKVYKRKTDPLGNKVIRIPDKESPDKRSKFWVKEVQTIGN
jgi:DNA-formamidopyrimidine glycosylase